jgi:hypothetical protein
MFSNKISKEWQYNWFGIWGAEEKYLGIKYQKEDYIDTTCPKDIRDKIVFYLINAPFALVAQQPAVKCPFCEDEIYLSAYKSDDTWLWSDSLVHYVAKHNFCIPNLMVEHILLADGVPPQELIKSHEELPWP